MFEDRIKDEIQSSVSVCFGEHIKLDEITIEKPNDRKFGDFSSNISFKLAKKLKKSPVEIAEKIALDLGKTGAFESVQAVSGFLNFSISKKRYSKLLGEILRLGADFGSSKTLKGQKIQIEFISANPTGPFTLANGRGGFSGDALANVMAFCGAKVTREYYVNDGGNQVKILGDSILAATDKIETREDLYQGTYIKDWANKNKNIIEEYSQDPMSLGRAAAAWILENFNKPATKKIGINFDNWFSEYKMIKSGEVEETIKKFTEQGFTYEKDGALWMKTSKFGDDKDRVLVKSDGERTYFANDVAYHFDKLHKRKFDLVVNFWGADHHGYVKRMLAAVEAMGYPGKLKIVIFQLVKLIKNGKEFKMSKRKGTYVTMDDLLDLIGAKTKEAADVARFFFLSRSFNTHMDFDLDLAKERSEKNPVFYVKYAHARMHGILTNNKLKNRSNNLSGRRPVSKKVRLELLTDEAELTLIDKLSELPVLVQHIVTSGDYPVHLLTSYAVDVAKKFHHFYDKCKVIDPENTDLTEARLALTEGVQVVLQNTAKLIGIDLPERM